MFTDSVGEPLCIGFTQAFDKYILEHFAQLVLEGFPDLNRTFLERTLHVTFFQSGYVGGGFLPTLKDCGTVESTPVMLEWTPWTCVRQRVFVLSWDREIQRKKQSLVVMIARGGDQKLVLVGTLLLLCQLSFPTVLGTGQHTFVPYMGSIKAVRGVEEALGCVWKRWATEDEFDRTLNIGKSVRSSEMKTAKCSELIPFKSTVEKVQVLRSNRSIHPFSAELPW